MLQRKSNPESSSSDETFPSSQSDSLAQALSLSALINLKNNYGDQGTTGKFIRIGSLIIIMPQAVKVHGRTIKLYHNNILTNACKNQVLQQEISRNLAEVFARNIRAASTDGIEDAGWFETGDDITTNTAKQLKFYGQSAGYGAFPPESRQITIQYAQKQLKPNNIQVTSG